MTLHELCECLIGHLGARLLPAEELAQLLQENEVQVALHLLAVGSATSSGYELAELVLGPRDADGDFLQGHDACQNLSPPLSQQ